MKNKTDRHEFSDREIISALEKSMGRISMASQILGSSQEMLYKRIQKQPELKIALEGIRERELDAAEIKLQELIKKGEFQAIKFYLSTVGAPRGYGTEMILNMKGKIEADVNLANLSLEELKELERLTTKATDTETS